MPAFESEHLQEILKDKTIQDDAWVIAMKSNYCNCLFNLYRYQEAVAWLKKLVVTLENQVRHLLSGLSHNKRAQARLVKTQ